MYFRDHPPPHFHIVTHSREEAQMSIGNLSVLAGGVPPSILAAARAWAQANVDVLRGKWRELHPE